MAAYSIELTINGGNLAAKAFRAVKEFDETVVMGTILQLFREHRPLEVQLDRADRAPLLRRLLHLLDELERMQVSFTIMANNVPRSSHLWEPTNWTRADVEREMLQAERIADDRRRAADIMKDYIPPEPPPAKRLFDQRWEEIDFRLLLESEQKYLLVWAMRAEIYNGGFDQYFFNSAGDDAIRTLALLEAMGRPRSDRSSQTPSACSLPPAATLRIARNAARFWA